MINFLDSESVNNLVFILTTINMGAMTVHVAIQ